MDTLLSTVLDRVVGKSPALEGASPFVSREEAEAISLLPAENLMDIVSLAGTVRAKCAPGWFRCGIVNAKSGRCPENCAFCAQSAHHSTGVAVYPLMKADEIVERARRAKEYGAERFGIVTSGTALPEKDLDELCRAVERISGEVGMGVCGSLGMLSPERAARFRAAGMTRYHHNLETAESFFPHICSTHRYSEDTDSVKAALAAGLEVCSGGIIGLGESREQRVELAFTVAELGVTSIPMNFLMAVQGTRLADEPRLKPEEALRTIAVFRLINPFRDILIAGGRSHVLGGLESWIFAAGANGMMVGDYLTKPGASPDSDAAMMRSLGVM
ncbi:MAG: biotin synthase BioB [Mailhella sp.]|nr:biotin synthase BioB [Mailhella sp.]